MAILTILKNWFKRIDSEAVNSVFDEIVDRETKKIEVALVVLVVLAIHIALFVLGYMLFAP